MTEEDGGLMTDEFDSSPESRAYGRAMRNVEYAHRNLLFAKDSMWRRAASTVTMDARVALMANDLNIRRYREAQAALQEALEEEARALATLRVKQYPKWYRQQ